jgi:hypothetical protein
MLKNTDSLGKRVNVAFADPKVKEFANDYLAVIQEDMRYINTRFQKLIIQIFLLFFVFIILSGASVVQITLGSVQLSDLSLIEKLLPIVIAYTYYELAGFAAMRQLQNELHDRIVELLYKPLYNNDLELYLRPSSALNTADILMFGTKGFLSDFSKNLTIPLYVIIFFGALVFEIYAFNALFVAFGFVDIVVWLALLVSLFFLLQGLIFFALYIELGYPK